MLAATGIAKGVSTMNKKRRRRVLGVLLPLFLVILLGFLLFQIAIPKVGYCFDAEFDETGERLYVTAGYKGLHVFRISTQGAVAYITTYFDDGYYRYVEVVGDKAYIANSQRGLEILDIQDDEPRPVWAQSGSKGYGIHIEGNKAYLASNEYGLQILDVTNPEAPIPIGSLTTTGRMWDVWVIGEYAFIADRDLGLIVVDVSTPSQPHEIGSLSWGEDPMAEIIDGAGEYVYVASGVNGLVVVDISDPRKPVSTFQYDPGLDSYGEGVIVQREILYLSMIDSSSGEENGLHIFDLHDPSSPMLLSKYPVTDSVEDISVAGTHLAMANTLSGVALFDVHAPANPILVSTYPGRFWRFVTKYVQ